MNQSINPFLIYDGVLLRLVPVEHPSGRLLYVSFDGIVARVVYPNGYSRSETASFTTSSGAANHTDANRKQRYLKYKNVWGSGIGILVSHAVYLAWVGPIDKPCIDHKNGVTTDNRWQNLEPVTYAENSRRARILNGLRQVGINPAELPFSVLDKYLDPKNQTTPDCGAEPNRDYDPFIER